MRQNIDYELYAKTRLKSKKMSQIFYGDAFHRLGPLPSNSLGGLDLAEI